MRLPASFVLPLLVGAVQAASETAKVYIFQEAEYATTSKIPTLTPEEARLVIAQRLGVSRYHSLNDASEDVLAHIDAFGGLRKQLFAQAGEEMRSQRVTIIDSAAPDVVKCYQTEWGQAHLAFEISDPPSSAANHQLVRDITEQSRSLFLDYDGHGRSDISYSEAADLNMDTDEIQSLASHCMINVKKYAKDFMFIIIPESSQSSLDNYGTYDMPLRSHRGRSVQIEEPIEDLDVSITKEPNVFSLADEKKKNGTRKYSTCYSTNETCQSETSNCFDHGHCYLRYNQSEVAGASCYACKCEVSIKFGHAADGSELWNRAYWGGAACQKEDVSSPFWLLVGISVVLVGAISAGIGMLFSIGEEKLPSVIGAGVSGAKTR